jgi:hypothetical protein
MLDLVAKLDLNQRHSVYQTDALPLGDSLVSTSRCLLPERDPGVEPGSLWTVDWGSREGASADCRFQHLGMVVGPTARVPQIMESGRVEMLDLVRKVGLEPTTFCSVDRCPTTGRFACEHLGVTSLR